MNGGAVAPNEFLNRKQITMKNNIASHHYIELNKKENTNGASMTDLQKICIQKFEIAQKDPGFDINQHFLLYSIFRYSYTILLVMHLQYKPAEHQASYFSLKK